MGTTTTAKTMTENDAVRRKTPATTLAAIQSTTDSARQRQLIRDYAQPNSEARVAAEMVALARHSRVHEYEQRSFFQNPYYVWRKQRDGELALERGYRVRMIPDATLRLAGEVASKLDDRECLQAVLADRRYRIHHAH